ncbi:hypothetical protein [Mesorhizobium sp.]|uniref:hypothetical protein n=1 Tax=Mesorhizobium sp. TaxID=1871066 RepID=UPI000FE9BD3C|nr:hypothetical protein [Mesorhizobium sp.]RWN35823.1 MAG: hypothetical protein EOR95_12560 [Mesorhizobium sp.]
MTDTLHTPECRTLADALWPLASKYPVKPDHWITTPRGEYETYHGYREWCRECATFMIRHLRRKDPRNREEYRLDGGWRSEHDGPIYCAQCGVRLTSAMLSTGAGEEVGHYAENPPDPTPQCAYDIHEVLQALEYTRQRDAELVAEAVEIGRKLVAAIEAAGAAK